ncbi:Eco57I restriction-modification methylase domain-containing protein [Candidatus Pyrohabitans sp.]
MQTPLGENRAFGKSELIKDVNRILTNAKQKVKVERRALVFSRKKKLSSEDLKTPQDPEEFTKKNIIEKILELLKVDYSVGERRFRIPGGMRKADYEISYGGLKFLVEAKPTGDDLWKKDGAVNQVKELFLLHETKRDYSFGIATDGLRWVFISNTGEFVTECDLVKDFAAIENFITGKSAVRTQKKEAEITKRFYEWYNALLHGGSYRNLKGERDEIGEEYCLVSSILNVKSESDREEIAQVIVDRLIFIKFLQAKRIIKEDILAYLANLSEDVLNSKLKQLFFSVFNVEEDKRIDVDPKFEKIPYLNGSLFERSNAERQNPDYLIRADILKRVIEFLDTFKFVYEGEAGEDSIDPEILGYIFERAMTAGDRKGTGAYYTPKYITRYICENTIYPYILEKSKEYLKEKKGYKGEELPKSFEDLLRLRSLTLSDIYNNVVMKLTVLDPACGSGAFLYQAANILLEIYRKIEKSLGLKNPEFNLKKVILRNSIYGVDLNHKAVEIAKLRMWLWIAESYDPDKRLAALPNIEYNIRAGNTLIGYIDISKLREFKISLDDFLGLETPLDELLQERDKILSDYKMASGEKARELKRKIEEMDGKIKRRLDILLFQEMRAKKIDISPTEFAKLEPFHWGYEFHRVFENGEGGFSVVVGNPPYVRQESIKEQKPILKEYYETYKSTADLYVYFYERAHKLLKQGGMFGFISSNKFMRANYGKPLREFLTKGVYIREIIDFGELPVFEDAATFPAIVLTEKSNVKGRSTLFTPVRSLEFQSLDSVVSEYAQKLPPEAFEGFNWSLGKEHEIKIMKKIEKIGQPLGEYVGGKILRGILTGFNKAFIISKEKRDELIKRDPKSAEIIKPLIVGDDIRKYEINFRDRYLIFTRRGIDIESYPAIKKHLEKFKDRLMPKPQDWDEKRDGKWNGRKPGAYKWYEIQDTIAYYKEFEKPKIVLPDIAMSCRFAFDTENYFVANTGYIIPINDLYLLSLLNSRLIEEFYRNIAAVLGDPNKRGRMRFIYQYLVQIPIRRINFNTPEEERNRLVGELKELYAQSNFTEILSRVEAYLPKDEDGNFITAEEKSDVVHDFLAFLAERMTEMNKEKQAEIKRFLAWLEEYLGVKIEDMNLKTKVREFYKMDWEEYYKVLKRSKGKVRKVDLASKEAEEKLREAFLDSTGRLKPLLERIKETDGLIDQIVYRLYGLSEEEIEVVEGG